MSWRATHEGADLVIVNTCGFLDSAKAESLEAIGDALAENGKVIVTGCMGAEPEKITARFPNVLAVTGPQQYESVLDAVHRAAPPRHDPFLDLVPPEGIKLTPRHYAYLKISEGCNNRCTFCIIPKLRGDLVSRPAADVLREAETAGDGRRQGAAGHLAGHLGLRRRSQIRGEPWQDREVRAKFLDLARALGELGVWVRLHYVYPYPHVDDVIPLMAEGKVLPYLDIPFQHAAPDVLKRMRRPAAQEKTLERIRAGARSVPTSRCARPSSSVFRARPKRISTYLLDWLDEAELDRVGCFRYEPVAGAAANDLAAPVPDEVKEERWHRFMQRQQAISARRLQAQGRHPPAGHHRRGRPERRQGPHQGRRAGDRRRRLRREPPAAARRRNRHRQDRARRRLRSARHRGGILISPDRPPLSPSPRQRASSASPMVKAGVR